MTLVQCATGQHKRDIVGATKHGNGGSHGGSNSFVTRQQLGTTSNDWQSRARYFNSGYAFAMLLPPVPSVQFTEQCDEAFSADIATGFVDMDLSAQMQTPFAATTLFALSRYMCIRAGEPLSPVFDAIFISPCLWHSIHCQRTAHNDHICTTQWH